MPKLLSTHWSVNMALFEAGKTTYPDLDYAVVADEQLVAFGFDWPMADELEEGIHFPYKKLPEYINNKWSEFAYAFGGTHVQLFLVGNDHIVFVDCLTLDIIRVKFIEPNELLEKIKSNKEAVVQLRKEKRRRIEIENKYAAQTHFNKDQRTTITTILNALDEARAKGKRVLMDYFVYSNIETKMIATPLDKDSVFGDDNRWYSIKKRDFAFKDLEQIEFRINSQIGESGIAKQYGWHNPKHKKHVSEEQFRAFLNGEISFEQLKHKY